MVKPIAPKIQRLKCYNGRFLHQTSLFIQRTGIYWSHIITKFILFLRQNSLFLHEKLIILFEYPQSISGDNFLPNTCTIIAYMKQHMHLLVTRSVYCLGKGKKPKKDKWRLLQLQVYSSTIIYFILKKIFVRVITHFFNWTFSEKEVEL